MNGVSVILLRANPVGSLCPTPWDAINRVPTLSLRSQTRLRIRYMETPEHNEPAYREDADVEITDLELPDDGTSNVTWLFAHAFLRWQRFLTRRRFRLLSGFGLLLLALILLLLNLPA